MAAHIEIEGGAGATRPPAHPRDAGTRLGFRTKVVLVWLGIFAIIGVLFWLSKFDVAWMRREFHFIITGLGVTVFIALVSIAFAVILALLGALGRLSKNSVAYGVSGFYTSFFRGTPLIVQIFLIYLALPQVGVNLQTRGFIGATVERYFILSAVLAGIIALSLNYGAYMTEIFRAGILSVGPGQTEAADALGMSYGQRMKRVVLPQAFKVIIPPTGNEFIAMIKDTALLSFVASSLFWYDIFKRAVVVGNADFRNMEALIVVASIYWGLTAIFSFFQAKLEARVSRGYVRHSEPSSRNTGKSKLLSTGGAGGRGGGGAMMMRVADPQGDLESEHEAKRAEAEEHRMDETPPPPEQTT